MRVICFLNNNYISYNFYEISSVVNTNNDNLFVMFILEISFLLFLFYFYTYALKMSELERNALQITKVNIKQTDCSFKMFLIKIFVIKLIYKNWCTYIFVEIRKMNL